MKLFKWTGVLILSLIVSAGCASKNPVLPVHDEVLVYELPYDLTYLKVLDGLQTQPDWNLEITDKENGTIQIRNMDYDGIDESDKRVLVFLIKRIGPGETSIELAPQSQQVLGAGDMMKAVSEYLSREV